MFFSFPVLHQHPISSPTPKGEKRCRCVAAWGQLEEPIHGESLPFQPTPVRHLAGKQPLYPSFRNSDGPSRMELLLGCLSGE